MPQSDDFYQIPDIDKIMSYQQAIVDMAAVGEALGINTVFLGIKIIDKRPLKDQLILLAGGQVEDGASSADKLEALITAARDAAHRNATKPPGDSRLKFSNN